MPTIITQTGDEQEVSQADFDRLYRQVEASERGTLLRSESEGGNRAGQMHVWDQVDGTETWLPLQTVQKGEYAGQVVGLLKVVSKCSACRYASIHKGQVMAHVRAIREESDVHQQATGNLSADGVMHCTGCRWESRSRPQDVWSHIKSKVAAGPTHINAQELVMRRFGLEPPAAWKDSGGDPVATEILSFPSAPDVNQAKRSRRKRKRSRGRKSVAV